MALYDVIIVGGGPAGLSAALVLGRCRRRVLVCDSGHPRNSASHELHGYLTRDGIPPKELLHIGREQCLPYGVEFRDIVINDAKTGNPVEVVLNDKTIITCRKLLLATGIRDELPAIEGITDFYGQSVFHCPYCDGWEMRDQPLAIYGAPKQAVNLALSLFTWSRELTVCTNAAGMPNARDAQKLIRHQIALRTEPILRLDGHNGALERILFKEGPPLECRGMFFSTGQGQRSSLGEKLGGRFDKNGHVIVDRRGRTGIPNVFLAGDAAGDVQFAIVAAADGAKAAVAINQELQEEDRRV